MFTVQSSCLAVVNLYRKVGEYYNNNRINIHNITTCNLGRLVSCFHGNHIILLFISTCTLIGRRQSRCSQSKSVTRQVHQSGLLPCFPFKESVNVGDGWGCQQQSHFPLFSSRVKTTSITSYSSNTNHFVLLWWALYVICLYILLHILSPHPVCQVSLAIQTPDMAV